MALVKVTDGVNVTERIQNKTSSYFTYCLLVLLHVWINQLLWRKTVMVLKFRPASWTCECHHWRQISCLARRMFTAGWQQELRIGSWMRRWMLLCILAVFLHVSQDASHICTVSTTSVKLPFKYMQNVASTLKQSITVVIWQSVFFVLVFLWMAWRVWQK